MTFEGLFPKGLKQVTHYFDKNPLQQSLPSSEGTIFPLVSTFELKCNGYGVKKCGKCDCAAHLQVEFPTSLMTSLAH